jgi:hypothetical protein
MRMILCWVLESRLKEDAKWNSKQKQKRKEEIKAGLQTTATLDQCPGEVQRTLASQALV